MTPENPTASTVVRLREFGGILVTRDQGEPIRKTILELVAAGHQVEVVLDGVDSFAPSFMDEVLGKCLQELGHERFRKTIHLVSESEEYRHLTNVVLTNRIANL